MVTATTELIECELCGWVGGVNELKKGSVLLLGPDGETFQSEPEPVCPNCGSPALK